VTGPIRVLIADEHAGTRAEMGEAVEQDGRFTVVAEATDGAAAVQAALSERPDLCLVDIRMPASGIAATREITARLPETKVVMTTHRLARRDDLFSALRASAIGYLHKDIDPDRLPQALTTRSRGARRSRAGSSRAWSPSSVIAGRTAGRSSPSPATTSRAVSGRCSASCVRGCRRRRSPRGSSSRAPPSVATSPESCGSSGSRTGKR
jgi:DNA-binding NarL/FixJ family response regulator